MDYHSDRFEDFSVLIYVNKSIVGLIPANRSKNTVYSHQGLTYGGLLLENFDAVFAKEIMTAVEKFYKDKGVIDFQLKSFPSSYPQFQSIPISSFFKNSKSKIITTHKSLAIDYSKGVKIHKTKLKHQRKGLDCGLEIRLDNDFKTFWTAILTPMLKDRFQTKPVHSLEEIEQLHSFFPDKILQYNVYLHDKILGGITIYNKGSVVKSQYSATTLEGQKNYAIDVLFLYLIEHYKNSGAQFFCMGTVTTNDSLGYNPGLLKQKQELGCCIYSQQIINFSLHD
jgi:hypothetical protein